MNRREFWVRLLAPVAAFFGVKDFGNSYRNVLVRRRYMMAGHDPLVMYRYSRGFVFENNKLLSEMAERLGRNAALRMDENIRKVLDKNG